MNEAMHEQLSALSDGELRPDEVRFLLRRLDGEGASSATWGRFQLARICLRRQNATLARAGFATAVMQALERDALPQRGRSWFKTAVGGLVAASVAAVALLAIAPAPAPTDLPVEAVAATPALPVNTGLRTEDLRPQIPAQTVSAGNMVGPLLLPAPVLTDPQLDGYFIRHGDAAYGTGRHAFVPYVYVTSSPTRAEGRDPNARIVAARPVQGR